MIELKQICDRNFNSIVDFDFYGFFQKVIPS